MAVQGIGRYGSAVNLKCCLALFRGSWQVEQKAQVTKKRIYVHTKFENKRELTGPSEIPPDLAWLETLAIQATH